MTPTGPEASIVISTYNRRDMLAAALSCALAQQGVEVEVVVVDNGSTDDTAAFLSAETDPRVVVTRNDVSLGPTGGRNCGIARARGRWVALLDDDDLWAPTKLRDQIDAANKAGRIWSYTGCVYIDGQGHVLGGRPPLPPSEVVRQLPRRYVIPGGLSSMAWRRDVSSQDLTLDPQLSFMTDWDLSLQLLAKGPPAGVPSPLVAYRQHANNISKDVSDFQQEMTHLSASHRRLMSGKAMDVGAHWRFLGSTALQAGQRLRAVRHYAAGVQAGDVGSLVRLPLVLAPKRVQAGLRRRVISSSGWLAEAEAWLENLESPRAH